MILVDSSAWLEYFAGRPSASFFAHAIERTRDLLVPALGLYEVLKRVLEQRGGNDALQAAALMQQGRVVPLDALLALNAARLRCEHRIPMADSITLATARAFDAVLWTQDADLEGLPDVRYRKARG